MNPDHPRHEPAEKPATPAVDAAADETTRAEEPTCKCGYGLDHIMVSPERNYSLWGWFLALIMNAGATPNRIDWICRRCRTVLKTSSDPEVCNAHRA